MFQHPKATLYHLSGWKDVIKKTYGHKTYYLMAFKDNSQPLKNGKQALSNHEPSTMSIAGILPLVHLKHFLFSNSLISIPFFDIGGIIADNKDIEEALLRRTVELAEDIGAKHIELRHMDPLSWIGENKPVNYNDIGNPLYYTTKSHKVRMVLDLPGNSDALMKSFKSNLRRKIRKPVKEGLYPKMGDLELIDDFYEVFAFNMRGLGSPVHSKKFMKNVLEEFPDKAKIVIVYKGSQPLACSLIVGFKHTLENPWVSALREYSRLSPNMLLYWTMLEYACNNGCAYFDFGRSTPEGSTYKFKEQWWAKPTSLYWHYISLNRKPMDKETSEKSELKKAIQYWQKLPVPVTRIVGPMTRKHIGL